MASVNKVILVGNLGRDPDTRYLPDGSAVANLAIATTEKYKDKNGDTQEATEWHRVSFFGKAAEVCGQYLAKGSQIYVEGSLRTRKWQDKDGNDRYTTEIRGDRMQMLGGKRGGDDSGDRPRPEQQRNREAARDMNRNGGMGSRHGNGFEDLEHDIPF